MESRLVLVDFDGTVTRKDTLFEFIKFYHGIFPLLGGLAILSPVLLGYKLRIIANDVAKQVVLRYFFGNATVAEFKIKSAMFAASIIPRLIRPGAEALLRQELSRNSVIAIVSASPENWVKPWCDALGVNCLATRLEIIDGKISGKILGANCYGEEKVRRIREVFQVEAFDKVIAYGDSRGDKEMLMLADEKYPDGIRSQNKPMHEFDNL